MHVVLLHQWSELSFSTGRRWSSCVLTPRTSWATKRFRRPPRSPTRSCSWRCRACHCTRRWNCCCNSAAAQVINEQFRLLWLLSFLRQVYLHTHTQRTRFWGSLGLVPIKTHWLTGDRHLVQERLEGATDTARGDVLVPRGLHSQAVPDHGVANLTEGVLFGALVCPFRKTVLATGKLRLSSSWQDPPRNSETPERNQEDLVSKTQQILMRSTFSSRDLMMLMCSDVRLAGHGFKGSWRDRKHQPFSKEQLQEEDAVEQRLVGPRGKGLVYSLHMCHDQRPRVYDIMHR